MRDGALGVDVKRDLGRNLNVCRSLRAFGQRRSGRISPKASRCQFVRARAPGVDQNKYFTDALKHVVNKGREGRLFGVNHNGICLLIAYITEIIQQGMFDYDSQNFHGQPG